MSIGSAQKEGDLFLRVTISLVRERGGVDTVSNKGGSRSRHNTFLSCCSSPLLHASRYWGPNMFSSGLGSDELQKQFVRSLSDEWRALISSRIHRTNPDLSMTRGSITTNVGTRAKGRMCVKIHDEGVGEDEINKKHLS